MKKSILVVLLLLGLLSTLVAQESDPLVDSFIRNFARASLQTKIQIIQDAGESDLEGMGLLYEKALDFVLANSHLLMTDPLTQQLAVLATKYIGDIGYGEAKYRLWELFETDRETTIRVEIMITLGEIAKGDAEIVERMNTWLDSANNRLQSGTAVDKQVVAACVISLGKLADQSSFPVLFTARIIGYSDAITASAEESLYQTEGDLKELFTQVIRKNPIPEKLVALGMALESLELTDEEKGEIAEVALDVGIQTTTPDFDKAGMLRELRHQAVLALTQRMWSKATQLVIKDFNITVLEYDRGVISKSYFISSIDALGAMKTHEAAERLNLYLGLLNSYVEGGQKVDEQIALAVVNNLGQLGDQIASDYLLFVGYIGYSDAVKKAAREAFKNLKRR